MYQTVESFSSKINQFLLSRLNYQDGCNISLNDTVCAYSETVDLYLRFAGGSSRWPADTLVIARIAFKEQRAGHGTSLLQFLAELGGVYGYANIAVEQTHSGEGIQNFVRKYGFRPLDDNRNWIVSVTDLLSIAS